MTRCSLSHWTLAGSPLVLLGLSATASAQSNWVDFTDQTSTRLVMTSVDKETDDEEKDFHSGDFDQDGDMDVVVVRKVPFTLAGPRTNVLLMNENGVLVERTTQYASEFSIPDDTRDVWVFDADNDGWLDFVTATTFFEQPRLFRNLGNDGMGNWQGFLSDPNWMTAPFSPAPKFCSVIAGDVNNDGWMDLFFSDYENTLNDRLVMNNQDGTFTDESPTRLLTGLFNSTFGTQGHIEDFNGDGWADIMNTSGSFDEPDINYNDGAGFFREGETLPEGAVYQSAVDDFDNDDDLDLYICDDSQDYMFYNEGTLPNGFVDWSNAVAVTNSFLTIGFNHHTHIVDIDRDGFVDVGTADVDVDISGCDGQFALLRNSLSVSPSRGFTDPNTGNQQPWNTFGNYDFDWVDINGDGCLDMIQGLCVGYKVFIQSDCDVVVEGPGTDFCNGDGGDQMGCTDCPCGNNAPQGTVGGCLNSAGTSSRLVATGSTSISLPSGDSTDLRFQAEGMPATSFGVLISGNGVAPGNAANPCFGLDSGVQFSQFDGLRCAVQSTQRHGGRSANASGIINDSSGPSRVWGGEAQPTAGLAVQAGFVAGQTRYFQINHREDAMAGCMRGLNNSQAVGVTFTP